MSPGAAPPSVRALLDAAVAAVGGVERPGQVRMAEAVADSMDTGRHLLVQAGTGTGKSLAYLVPALLQDDTVVVATATIALQRQLIERDLPLLVTAAEPLLRRRPSFAILKGRRNYLCLHRLHGGPADADDDEVLFEPRATSALGREMLRLRGWADETDTGDRDDLVPGVSERAWSQVAVSARECLGAARCPFGAECFAERAREEAAHADVVVTNHALLAIGALEGIPVLPGHDIVVVDEGHELVDRVTGVATAELGTAQVERAARRARRLLPERDAEALADASEALGEALAVAAPGRLTGLPPELGAALVALRDAAHRGWSALSGERGEPDDEAARRQARAGLESLHTTAARLLAGSADDVAWLAVEERRGPVLRVAPLDVGDLLSKALFGDRTVVLTSATLELGGSFTLVADGLGLGRAPEEAGEAGDADQPDDPEPDGEPDDAEPGWTGLDVGSPFDYPRQGILYVARRLPPPGRDGISDAALDELAALVEAAGGRTLGLFSSTRAAVAAAAAMRERLDVPVLCQGDDATALLVRQFAADAATCLFGTLSLWQGVDVPGSSCQLVVIDRLPFPRPDDPLMSARQRAVTAAGGNGFMAVTAAHAALRLAQGSGRLIRTAEDRGVVAVLDSRLATARYGGFLRASLPPFWYTTDPAQVRRSLAAIRDTAPPPRQVPGLDPAAPLAAG